MESAELGNNCQKCGKSFLSTTAFELHSKYGHVKDLKKETNGDSEETLNVSIKLEKVNSFTKENTLINCDICNKNFASKKRLNFHKKSVHSGHRFHCDKRGFLT